MRTLTALLKREPAMSAGIVSAACALAAAFGFRWSPAVVGPVLAVVTLLLSMLVRSRVTPAKPRQRGEHAAP